MVRITLINNEVYTIEQTINQVENSIWYLEEKNNCMYYFDYFGKRVLLNIKNIIKIEEL